MFRLETLFFSLIFLTATLAQDIDTSGCQCDIPRSGARWMEADTDFCFGCDQFVRRLCQLSSGEAIRCRVRLSCPISECSGHWGPWDNNGPCNNVCGPGFQKQKRICYRAVNNTSMRGTLCANGFGRSEQARHHPCRSARGCSPIENVVAVPATADSTTTQTMTESTETTQQQTTNQQQTLKRVKTTARSTAHTSTYSSTTSGVPSTTIKTTTAPPVSTSQPFELPIILGSVAVICIAIIIALVIIFKRRSSNKLLKNSNTSFESTSNADRDDHFYEEVGPALPGRNIKINSKTNTSTEALTVQNVLYTCAENDKGNKRPASTTSREIPEGIYNEPGDSYDHLDGTCSTATTDDSYVTLNEVHVGKCV